MSLVPSFSPDEYARRIQHPESERAIRARLTFQSGTIYERSYALINNDPVTTRGYAVGELLTLVTSGYSDTLDLGPEDNPVTIDLDPNDLLVKVEFWDTHLPVTDPDPQPADLMPRHPSTRKA